MWGWGPGAGRVAAWQAGGGSPPEGNRLLFIPAQKGPSEPPRRRLQPSRQVLRPEGGYCGGDKGPLVTGSLLGSLGTGRGRWGAELCLPPRPPLARRALGFHPRHGPCRHQRHPQPCLGVDPDLFAIQTLLCATLGVQHDAEGQPSPLPGGWHWGLEHLPRHGQGVMAKQALVPAPSFHRPSTARSGQGMPRAKASPLCRGLSTARGAGQLFKSSQCVLPQCPIKRQLPSKSCCPAEPPPFKTHTLQPRGKVPASALPHGQILPSKHVQRAVLLRTVQEG